MKNFFDFNLKGSQIFKPVLLCWVIMIALSIAYTSVAGLSAANIMEASANRGVLSSILILVLLVGMISVTYFIYYFIVKHSLDAISYGGEKFTTYFVMKDFLMVVLKGLLLTVVTLGIYSPWFLASIIKYFASHTTFRDKEFRFKSNGGTLFGIMVLYVVLPVFVVALVYGLAFAGMAAGSPGPIFGILGVVVAGALLFLVGLYEVFVIKWMINFAYGGNKNIVVDVKPVPAAWFVIGQALLLGITLGFYYPAYMVRMYRYFMGRTILGEAIVEDQFGFTGTNGKFYWRLLGQFLLTGITLGIYFPWAYAKVMTMFVTHTYIEDVTGENRLMPNQD